MTAKFDAFKAALLALCYEHKVSITASYHDTVQVWDAGEDAEMDFDDRTFVELTAEEHALEDARRSKAAELSRIHLAELRVAEAKRREQTLQSPSYAAWRDEINANAERTRKKQMRISTNPNDPAYIDDRPRKVWLNEVEIADWIVADEFRRCVITGAGVMNGGVLIERLPEEGQVITGDGSGVALPPIDGGFSGIFVFVPDAPKPAAPVDVIADQIEVEPVTEYEPDPEVAPEPVDEPLEMAAPGADPEPSDSADDTQ